MSALPPHVRALVRAPLAAVQKDAPAPAKPKESVIIKEQRPGEEREERERLAHIDVSAT